MSTAPAKSTPPQNPPSIPDQTPHLSTPVDTPTSSSGADQEKNRKTKIPVSPRTPPKLTSLTPKSSSFRMAAPAAPKSPRKMKVPTLPQSPVSKVPPGLPSSSQLTAEAIHPKNPVQGSSSASVESGKNAVLPSSIPVLKIVKVQIPSDVLKQLEIEHIDHALMELLIADLFSSNLTLNQRHAVGRTDVAFYVDSLPEVLKPFAAGIPQSTISSSKLMQKIFADDFRVNTGWAQAKIFYANEMFKENTETSLALGETDAVVKRAELERLNGLAEVITKSILGHPATLKHCPLPRRLIKALVYADQRFHEKLLSGEKAKDWSTQQIREARCSLIKLLIVTRLLMPMVTALATKNPSQKEIWHLSLVLNRLLQSALALSTEIFIESFATATPSLQKLALEKDKAERIQARANVLKEKKPPRHIRSRSADTTPVDLHSLERREVVRKQRALEKTQKALSELGLDDADYANVIQEGKKALAETEEVRKAEADIKDFSLADLAQIQQMLAERDDEELTSLPADGELIPEHAQDLPLSTADLQPDVSSATPEKSRAPQT